MRIHADVLTEGGPVSVSDSNRRFATSETTARKVQGASDRRKEDSAEEKGEDVRARSARTTGRKVEGGRVTIGWQRKIER